MSDAVIATGGDSLNWTVVISTLHFHQTANVTTSTLLTFDQIVEADDVNYNPINVTATNGSVNLNSGAIPTTVLSWYTGF